VCPAISASFQLNYVRSLKTKTHAHKTGLTETRRTLIAIILFTQQTTEETREFCREGGEKCNSRTKGEQA